MDGTKAAAVCYRFAGQQFAKDDAVELRAHAGTRGLSGVVVSREARTENTRKKVQIEKRTSIKRRVFGVLE